MGLNIINYIFTTRQFLHTCIWNCKEVKILKLKTIFYAVQNIKTNLDLKWVCFSWKIIVEFNATESRHEKQKTMGNFQPFSCTILYQYLKLCLQVCRNPWMIQSSCVSATFKLDGRNIKCVSTIKAKVGSIYHSSCDCVLAINKVRQKIFIKLENILKLHKYICIPIAHSQRNNLENFTNSAQLDTNTLRTLHLHLHLLLHSYSYSLASRVKA